MEWAGCCRTLGLLTVAISFAAGCSSEPEPTGDLKALQGRWEQVEVHLSYKPDWIEISGSKATRRGSWDPVGGESKRRLRIEVDENANPKQLKLVGQNMTEQVSAYEVDGDTLCLTSMNRIWTQPLPVNWKDLPNAKAGEKEQELSTVLTVTYKYRRVAGR